MMHCDQSVLCNSEVTHIETTGWVYCEKHGIARRTYGYNTRKFTKSELNRLNRGETITY